MVENQCEKKVKMVRSDNGTEYTSDKFKEFCVDAGIEHQYTTVYTPQQNGVSERKNRTIMEMARCLLFEKKLPKIFWAETVNTTTYLLNRLPTRVLNNKTPFEAWKGYKPNVQHLKVFGCVCYSQVPKEKRAKLDEKAEVGVFMRYSSVTKGYRIYQPLSKKLIVSRDVNFDETTTWNWDEEGKDESEKEIEVFNDEPGTVEEEFVEENLDDHPVRGFRPLTDVYQRCNIVIFEPANYKEATTYPN